MQPDRSTFLARLIGPLLATLGVGLLANSTLYKDIALQLVIQPYLVYLSGVLLMLAGLAILNSHPHWTRDWRSIITLLGWIFACVGTFRIIAPNFPDLVARPLFSTTSFIIGAGVFFLAAGGILTVKGYVSDSFDSPSE